MRQTCTVSPAMPRSSRRATTAWLSLSLSACTAIDDSLERGTLPPLAEALVVVDTDLPVPQIAGRLRVDLYAEDGTWYTSRDIGRSQVSDWPASFSVYSPDTSRDTRVLIRL